MTDEADPFDRVVAREIELQEQHEQSELRKKRRDGLRSAAAGTAGVVLLFPVTYFFARHITWLLATHIFLIVVGVAAIVITLILPPSAFKDEGGGGSRRGATRGRGGYRSSADVAGPLSFFIMLLVLLPLTLIFGRDLTWLVITHVALMSVAAAGVVSAWFSYGAIGGSLSFLLMLLVLFPLTLAMGRHMSWLVITHVVLLAVAAAGVVSAWFTPGTRRWGAG